MDSDDVWVESLGPIVNNSLDPQSGSTLLPSFIINLCPNVIVLQFSILAGVNIDIEQIKELSQYISESFSVKHEQAKIGKKIKDNLSKVIMFKLLVKCSFLCNQFFILCFFMQLIETIGNPKYLEDSQIIDLIVGMSSSDIFMKKYFEDFLDWLGKNDTVWKNHIKSKTKISIFKYDRVLANAK